MGVGVGVGVGEGGEGGAGETESATLIHTDHETQAHITKRGAWDGMHRVGQRAERAQ